MLVSSILLPCLNAKFAVTFLEQGRSFWCHHSSCPILYISEPTDSQVLFMWVCITEWTSVKVGCTPTANCYVDVGRGATPRQLWFNSQILKDKVSSRAKLVFQILCSHPVFSKELSKLHDSLCLMVLPFDKKPNVNERDRGRAGRDAPWVIWWFSFLDLTEVWMWLKGCIKPQNLLSFPWSFIIFRHLASG